MSAPLVSVTLRQKVVAPTGGAWNAGETVGFPPDVAAGLIARGVARPLPKAPERPPADKMVKGAPTRK